MSLEPICNTLEKVLNPLICSDSNQREINNDFIFSREEKTKGILSSDPRG